MSKTKKILSCFGFEVNLNIAQQCVADSYGVDILQL